MGMGRGVANVTGIRQEEGFVKKQQYKGGKRVGQGARDLILAFYFVLPASYRHKVISTFEG